MRDNSWLEKRLDIIWNKYFTDVPRKNRVSIRFGRAATYRFGSIRQSYIDVSTQIIINGRFKSSNLPQRIVDHTIAHELVHYAQGFSSPHPRLHRYPHRGGVIDKELSERGLAHLVAFYKRWVKNYIERLKL